MDETQDISVSIEAALAWILEKDQMMDVDLQEKSLTEMRQIFNTHEEFLTCFKDFQTDVAQLMEECQTLIDSGDCPTEEKSELEMAMDLLHSHLEELGKKALEHRKHIHKTLMDLQQRQINHLRKWLFTAEDELSQFSDLGSTLAELKKQLLDYQNLQQDVNEQQEIVDSLSNLVWICDDNEGSSSPTFDEPPDELLDQLSPLAEKWSMVCKLISERTETLEDIVEAWETLDEEERRFNSSIVKLDRRLREMEEAAADMHIGSSFVSELAQRIERMESDVARQQTIFFNLNEKADSLVEKVGPESAAATEIADKLESLKDVWDATTLRISTLSHIVSKINEAALDELTTTDYVGEEPVTEDSLKKDQENLEKEAQLINQKRKKSQSQAPKKAKTKKKKEKTSKSVKEINSTVINSSSDLETRLNPSESVPAKKFDETNKLNIVNRSEAKLEDPLQSDVKPLEEKTSRGLPVKDDGDTTKATVVIQSEPVKKPPEQKQPPASTHPKPITVSALIKRKTFEHKGSIDLFDGIDLNQSSQSPKTTIPTSRQGTLTRCMPTTVESLAFLPARETPDSEEKLLNFFTLQELEDIDNTLRNVQIFMDSYDVFNRGDLMEYRKQEDALKRIKRLIEAMKPKTLKMNQEKWMVQATHPQGADYVNLIETIWTNCQSLRESYMVRHRQCWLAQEVVQQCDAAYKEINSFLDSAEKKLTNTDLDSDSAKKVYESLRVSFNELITVYGTFKVMSEKILSNLTIDGGRLKERINLTEERWKAVAYELASRNELIHNVEKNLDVLNYCRQLDVWIEKVNQTLTKFKGKIESNEMANIIQNEVKFLEKELQTQWFNMMIMQSIAETTEIEKDIEIREKVFSKLIVELPKARISIDNYLKSFKVFTKMLDEEIDWTIAQLESSHSVEDAREHEINFEKLIVMLPELESDAARFGFNPPSFVKEKMDSLKSNRELIQRKMRLNVEPKSIEWFHWLNNQVDYISLTFKDCSDERTLDQLRTIVSQIEHVIANQEQLKFSDENLIGDGERDNQNSSELETMNQTSSSYHWDSLREKTNALRIRLEANSGDELNQLLLSLQELIEWVIQKRDELNSMGDIGGDVVSLSKQQEGLTNLKASLEEERPIIETTLMSSRSSLPKGDTLVFSGENGAYRNRNVTQIKKTVRNIDLEVEKLSENWTDLLKAIDQRQSRLDNVMRKMISLQNQIDVFSGQLKIAEITKSKWIPISDAAIDQLHDLLAELQIYKENVGPLQKFIDQMNASATRLTSCQVLLSNAILTGLEELNARWKSIQVSVEERRKNLEQSVINHNQTQQQFLNEAVEPPWERSVAFNKVPYYINHTTETTHWDHPKMTELMNTLNELNEVKYSAYRTAMKLRSVQRHLCLDLVTLGSLMKIFDECELNDNEKLFNVPEVIAILQTIYETTASGDKAIVINVPLSIDLSLNWLLNLYDNSTQTGQIRVLSLKVGLITLCKATLEDKYRYMFALIADGQGLADQQSLALLLYDLIQIPRLLNEISAFGGSNVEPSVRSCFSLAGSKSTIECDDFIAWLQQKPQSTVWLPVLHRLAAAEQAKHQSKCNVCKQFPIIGFRYKCLLCFNFDMCQLCFFSARTTKDHKTNHPMQEYCVATTSGQDIKDFTRIIRNKFRSKRRLKRNPKYGYLPVEATEGEENSSESPLNSPSHTLQNPDSLDMHSKLEMYASRLAEVELDSNQDRNYEELDNEQQFHAQFSPEFGVDTINPDQLITRIAPDQRNELESIISGLELENKQLQSEYERLKIKKNQQSNGKGSSSVHSEPHLYSTVGSLNRRGDILTVRAEVDPYASAILTREKVLSAEAKALKTKEDELEAKRVLLEEQNKRLEATLKRLRQFLSKFPEASSLTNTLRSTHSDYTNPSKLTSSTERTRLHHSTNNSVASLQINGSSDFSNHSHTFTLPP